MRSVIALGGNCKKSQDLIDLIKDSDILIAADYGAIHFDELGLVPDILVGDMDSIPDDLLEKYEKKNVLIKKYNPDKDFTDSELAVEEATKSKSDSILLIGAFGDRLDHMFGNQMMALSLAQKGIDVIMTDGKTYFYTVSPDNSPFKYFVNPKNEQSSLFSLVLARGDYSNITINGLAYTLNEEKINFGKNRCISNVLPENVQNLDNHEIQIEITKGIAFFVHTKSK